MYYLLIIMWLLLVPIVAYLLYSFYQFATADADIALLRKRLKPGYLKGKVVWITGASSGIGEALSYELSSCDAKLILSARSEEKLAALRGKLKTPEDVRILVIDMSKPEAFAEAVAKATHFFGRVDILINNAGVTMRSQFKDVTEHVGRSVMEVDFFGPVLLTQALLPGMLSSGSGHIVNISSIAGKLPAHARSYYCAAKTALIALMNVLRLEMGEQNIMVTNVCPGPVQTSVDVNAFNPDGSKYNRTDPMISNGMTSKRCAELIAIAISNQMQEVWIAQQPFLIGFYLYQYWPAVYAMLSKRVISKASLRKLPTN